MLVSFAAQLERSPSIDILWQHSVEVLRHAGLDHAIHLTVASDFSKPILRSTLPDLYDELPPEKDPFLHHSCTNYRIWPVGTVFMDKYPYLSDAERAFIRRAGRRGLAAGLAIATRARGADRFGGFIVGNGMDRKTFLARIMPHAEELRLLCLLIHRRFEELEEAAPGRAGPHLEASRPMLAPELPSAFHVLSRRELEVIWLLAHGRSRKEAADICHLSTHTISDYAKSAYRKLGVRNRAQVAALFHDTPLQG